MHSTRMILPLKRRKKRRLARGGREFFLDVLEISAFDNALGELGVVSY